MRQGNEDFQRLVKAPPAPIFLNKQNTTTVPPRHPAHWRRDSDQCLKKTEWMLLFWTRALEFVYKYLGTESPACISLPHQV